MSGSGPDPQEPQGPAIAPALFPSTAEPNSPERCDETRLRAAGLAAPAFQRAVLAALVELTPQSRGPFQVRVHHAGAAFDVRLDECFKRYRHGELTPELAAEEVKAALGLPEAAVQAGGPYPRLAPATALPPGAFSQPCPFDPDLALFFVRTLPSGHVPLGRAAVSDPAALWTKALAKLRDLTLAQPMEVEGEGASQVLRYALGDGLDAARALLPDLMTTLAGWLVGRARVALPARDLLLAVGDADPVVLAQARALAAEVYARDPFPLSPRWYAVTEDGGLRALDESALY